jgi:hypothetical protein
MLGASFNLEHFESKILIHPFDIERIANEAWEEFFWYNDPPTIFLYGTDKVRLNVNDRTGRLNVEEPALTRTDPFVLRRSDPLVAQ